MAENYKHFSIEKVKAAIKEHNDDFLLRVINDLYAADIAGVMDELSPGEARYISSLLNKEEAADVLMELEDDVRERLLSLYSTREIAHEIIDNLESDDAADLISELPNKMRGEVLAHIEDRQQAQDIADLLEYPTNSAGGLMGKELIKVKAAWHVVTCIREMRKQAEEVQNIYTVYVVDDNERLIGQLSLEKLLIASPRDLVEKIYNPDVISVLAIRKGEEVASIMDKYNLVALPVIDKEGRLIGQITIDDVVDFIKESSDRDYQLMSGISQDIEATDKVWKITQGRLFWLVIALFGGIAGSRVVAIYEDQIQINPEMAFFMPLIAAMGGNVGVQSSALIVKGLANNTLTGTTLSKLAKELSVGLINGLVCSSLLMLYSLLFAPTHALALTVSVALMVVILFASVFGTFVPLTLNKLKIDPALATGPFITTTNDIVGLFIYFMIGRAMYGFFY